MREIEYRGKDKLNGEWVYGYYYKMPNPITVFLCDYILKVDFDEERVSASTDVFVVDKETLGQYTGLKDKNGKKIFEGDIIEIVNNLNEATKQNKHNTLVKFRDCAFVSTWQDLRFDGTYGEVYNHLGSYNTPIVTFEVIGNIHDNKELLGE